MFQRASPAYHTSQPQKLDHREFIQQSDDVCTRHPPVSPTSTLHSHRYKLIDGPFRSNSAPRLAGPASFSSPRYFPRFLHPPIFVTSLMSVCGWPLNPRGRHGQASYTCVYYTVAARLETLESVSTCEGAGINYPLSSRLERHS
jgi:hypothetical protein